MAAAIVLTRESAYAYKARRLKVLLDGADAQTIADGETVRLPVPAGKHRVRVKVDFYASPEVTVDVAESGEVQLVCRVPGGAGGIFKAFGAGRYLELEAADPARIVDTGDVDETKPPPDTSAVPAARSVFISYRRAESEHVTGRIYDHLTRRFGSEAVFKDVDSIPLGADFRDHLRAAITDCKAVLVVVGGGWETIVGEDGTPRLAQPLDHVRVEVELALERKVPVIPLMVRRSKMPRPEDLPESIRELAYRNGISIRPDPDFRHDVDRLIAALAELTP